MATYETFVFVTIQTRYLILASDVYKYPFCIPITRDNKYRVYFRAENESGTDFRPDSPPSASSHAVSAAPRGWQTDITGSLPRPWDTSKV